MRKEKLISSEDWQMYRAFYINEIKLIITISVSLWQQKHWPWSQYY